MLCLTDAALARVFIGATAVPREARRGWLADLASKFEQSPSPPLAPSTLPTRRWRDRERSGRILLRLEVDEAALVVGLIDRVLLDPLHADNRAAVTRAAERALAVFCDTSRGDGAIHDKLKVAVLLAALRRKTRGRSSGGKDRRRSAPAR
jgi:hypothetical protein